MPNKHFLQPKKGKMQSKKVKCSPKKKFAIIKRKMQSKKVICNPKKKKCNPKKQCACYEKWEKMREKTMKTPNFILNQLKCHFQFSNV
jgi:hypothetical protein